MLVSSILCTRNLICPCCMARTSCWRCDLLIALSHDKRDTMPSLEGLCCKQERIPTPHTCSSLCAGLAGAGVMAVDGAAGGAADGGSEAGHAGTGRDLRPCFPPPAAFQPQWLERLQDIDHDHISRSLVKLNRETLLFMGKASR